MYSYIIANAKIFGFSVIAGYFITPNATEYEFNVNVYSPVGAVVFEVLLIVEDISNFEDGTIIVNFAGTVSNYEPYAINGMEREVIFDSPTENPLITITLRTALHPNDSEVIYPFRIDYVAFGTDDTNTGMITVTLHEIGKLSLVT